MQTILVPLDGSAQAEQILPHVRLLASVLHAHVLLLQVVVDPEHEHVYATTSQSEAVVGSDHMVAWLGEQRHQWHRHRREVENYLETRAAALRAAGINVACEVQLGPPVATILAVAELSHASLIALASHGYSRLRRWVAGSVAEQIVRSTNLPVLLMRIAEAPPTTPEVLRRVLVPLDGSVFSRYALEHAITVAQGARAELIALQTLASSIEDYIGGSATLLDQRSILRENVRRVYAARFGEQCAAQAAITAAVGVGLAADAIVEEARQRHVDLIVLALPAHSALRHRSGGGIAERVFRTIHIPLLLVHSSIQHE